MAAFDILKLLGHIWSFLESYGYLLVGCVLLIYFVIKPFIESKLDLWHHQRSLREANDPDRVAVLEREKKRIRAKQQEEHLRRERQKLEEMKQKRLAQANEDSDESSPDVGKARLRSIPHVGMNTPLMPQTRRPMRFNRPRRT